MKELKNIVDKYMHRSADEKMALATVIRVEGSSYRRMGARMLVSENGTWVGGISGGCLEGDALKRARMAILKGKASIITYDTSTDDDHQIGVGLGCNGIIDVLFMPIKADDTNPLNAITKTLDKTRKTHKLITISKSSNEWLQGQILYFEGADSLKILKNECDIQGVAQLAEQLDKSKNLLVNDQLSLFIEVIPPALQILLFGHQYDLYPLIRQVAELGWHCKVIAPSSKVMSSDLFELIEPENMENLQIDQNTAAILMSHSLYTDKANLLKIKDWGLRYIGMLGPKVRSERILNELKDEGVQLSEDGLSRIFAPTGLDLGAANPEEIALSMVSEIKAVFAGRSAGHLRDRQVPINDRDKPMIFN